VKKVNFLDYNSKNQYNFLDYKPKNQYIFLDYSSSMTNEMDIFDFQIK